MSNIKIVIVDDHELFRDGLKLVINKIEGFEVVASFESGDSFLEHIDEFEFDLVLMDINMPGTNGIHTSEIAKSKRKEIKIIGISISMDELFAIKMIQHGADGYVQKNSDIKILEHAIRTVYQGGNYFTQEVLQKLTKAYTKEEQDPSESLSEREKEVLIQICRGLSSKEISEVLFISPKTVDVHRANLLSKTNCKNSVQLVIWAISNKLYTME